jgi:hypothetical protein
MFDIIHTKSKKASALAQAHQRSWPGRLSLPQTMLQLQQ